MTVPLCVLAISVCEFYMYVHVHVLLVPRGYTCVLGYVY